MGTNQTIAQRLTIAREKAGFSMNKLATLSGVSQGYISQIESGARNPSAKKIALLEKALGMAPGGLRPVDNPGLVRFLESDLAVELKLPEWAVERLRGLGWDDLDEDAPTSAWYHLAQAVLALGPPRSAP